MRTTVTIDDDLLKQAKILAASTGRTLSSVVEDALRLSLRDKPRRPRRAVRLPTFSGELRPGVDLDDNAALLELMEEGRDAPL